MDGIVIVMLTCDDGTGVDNHGTFCATCCGHPAATRKSRRPVLGAEYAYHRFTALG